MKHSIILQCHHIKPALNLGKLLNTIVPDCLVIYAYDVKYEDRKQFEKLDNIIDINVNYFAVDQGLFHLLLWYRIYKDPRYAHIDYFHLISQSDLPFMGIFHMDELVGSSDFYGEIGLNKPKKLKTDGLHKSSTWYGISRKVLKYIHDNINELVSICMEHWVEYSMSRGKFTGGYDEYLVGKLLWHLENQAGFVRDPKWNLRFILFPSSKAGYSGEGRLLSNYGRKSDSYASPIILENTEHTRDVFEHGYYLFGRKFEFESDSYNYFYNRLIEYAEKEKRI